MMFFIGNKVRFCFLVIGLTAVLNLFAADSRNDVNKMSWDGVDVVWIKDEKFPLFNLNIYFADGALSDANNKSGETSIMFDNLMSGTRRYSQEQINDMLDYFGVEIGASVTHEYSVFSVSGLMKNMVPTVKMVCHLFKDSTFPKKIIKSELKKSLDSIDSMVSSHGNLAARAFRNISLGGTPYANPSSGNLKGLKNIKSGVLSKKLDYFNNRVKKRIYLSGPKEVLKLEQIIKKECGWTVNNKGTNGNYTRVANYKYKNRLNKKGQIILVTVPKANQAQVRIGRFLEKSKLARPELMTFSASFLGGGFTSQLMREVRVNRGLTYSIGAYAAAQRDYGRAGISTFTKNETVKEIIDVIRVTLNKLAAGTFKDDELERARGHLVGNYLFKFESAQAYLEQLISLDHMEMSYERLYKFPEIIKGFKKDKVVENLADIFGWKNQYIVVLGSKSLKKQLEKLGPVKVISYKKFL